VRIKKSGSVARVGSAMAHQQGSVHTPIEGQAHPPPNTRTHRAGGGDTQGSKSFQELGARIVHTIPAMVAMV
jgi:hypothetical protein